MKREIEVRTTKGMRASNAIAKDFEQMFDPVEELKRLEQMADLGVFGLSIALPYVGAAGIVTFGAAALNASEIIGDTSLGKEYAKYPDSIDGRPRDGYVTFDVTIV